MIGPESDEPFGEWPGRRNPRRERRPPLGPGDLDQPAPSLLSSLPAFLFRHLFQVAEAVDGV
jgi:hypothetical protein